MACCERSPRPSARRSSGCIARSERPCGLSGSRRRTAMTDTAVATREDEGASLIEQVVVQGDLAKLTAAQRVVYYRQVCESLGLNPLTRPFDYITLNGKLTLYVKRDATDQLRALRGISIDRLEPQTVEGVYVVTATGHDKAGRVDSATGAVPLAGLRGEALANALMKAETKAKRRLTLSLAGLGWLDETEVGSVPGAVAMEEPETTRPRTLREALERPVAPAQLPDATPEPIAAPGPSDAPTDGLTLVEFGQWLQANHIPAAKAREVRQRRFGDVPPEELTPAQWAALQAELEPLAI